MLTVTNLQRRIDSSLRKASHNLPIEIRTGETPRWMSHGPQPSPPDLVTKDPRLRILETPVIGTASLGPVTALVRRMRFVRAAAH